MQIPPVTPSDIMSKHLNAIRNYVNSPFKIELSFFSFNRRVAKNFPYLAKGTPTAEELISTLNQNR